jgi:hypothetical protein
MPSSSIGLSFLVLVLFCSQWAASVLTSLEDSNMTRIGAELSFEN